MPSSLYAGVGEAEPINCDVMGFVGCAWVFFGGSRVMDLWWLLAVAAALAAVFALSRSEAMTCFPGQREEDGVCV